MLRRNLPDPNNLIDGKASKQGGVRIRQLQDMRRQAFEQEQLEFVEKMKLQKEKASVNAAIAIASGGSVPK